MPDRRRPVSATLAIIAASMFAPFASGAAADATAVDELADLRDLLDSGKPSATVRYRYERVDQATFDKVADASTAAPGRSATRPGRSTG